MFDILYEIKANLSVKYFVLFYYGFKILLNIFTAFTSFFFEFISFVKL